MGIGFFNAQGTARDVTVQGISGDASEIDDYTGIFVATDNYFPVNLELSRSTITGSGDNEVIIASPFVGAFLNENKFFVAQSGRPQNGVLALEGSAVTINSCNFQMYSMGGTDPSDSISAGVRSNGAGVTITGSQFITCDAGVLVRRGSVSVTGSFFQGNILGVSVDSSMAVVNGNTIQGSSYGVYVYATGDQSSYVAMSFNDISGNSFGVYVMEKEGMVSLDARYNNIFDNTDGAINRLPDSVNMILNWWGNDSGPYNRPLNIAGTGNNVSSNIAFMPWLSASNPGGLPVSLGSSKVITQNDPLDGRVDGMMALMNGTGNANVTVYRYPGNPVDPLPSHSANLFVDLKLGEYSNVDKITFRVYYDVLQLPSNMTERDIRIYWWNGSSWSACSDAGVDTVSHFVWVNISNGSAPSLTQLEGTIVAPGTAAIVLNPITGARDTVVTITGSGFSPNDTVVVLFNGTQIGVGTTNGTGDLNNLSFPIMTLVQGVYRVGVVDSYGYVSEANLTVTDIHARIISIEGQTAHIQTDLGIRPDVGPDPRKAGRHQWNDGHDPKRPRHDGCQCDLHQCGDRGFPQHDRRDIQFGRYIER